jgi:hypothetical protein
VNDFTKDELEQIFNWGDTYTCFGSSWMESVHRPLLGKIQSMIDNYGKHEWQEDLHHMDIELCIKCGKRE